VIRISICFLPFAFEDEPFGFWLVLNQSYFGQTWLQDLISNILAISNVSADITLTNAPIGLKP
jgi:hypothetical protein